MNIVDMTRVSRVSQRTASNRMLIGAAALLFAASAAATLRRYAYMTAMSGTPMAGRWMLSAIWTPMCGQTWWQAAASFASMWAVMMPAMMLPVLVPMVLREREMWRDSSSLQSGLLTIWIVAGYFMFWMLAGFAVFPLGSALAAIAIRVPTLAHAAPASAGALVVLASLLQFTSWKAQRLACCRAMRRCASHAPRTPNSARMALHRGLRLGLQCGLCCGNWMAVLLVVGVMDPRAMAVITAVIAVERIAPCHVRVARIIGLAGFMAGVATMAHGL
ncbi:hypothetical protein LMG28688_04834 [Paraburkholderia caffeinitolerans]|uniref:Metal-binding integral membrane protein n=1 Tax=Paraburkholderia caffeinitolerans TaxID=1723730 RepID=A0A6J5GER4_9BURK|nr:MULTISPECIES: DUF2182 domain-containing protein [Paraburkholderia]CAB3798855.1 hypothetical protein LMG28688_04834 [Paraburkholderia caffeinitolerans]